MHKIIPAFAALSCLLAVPAIAAPGEALALNAQLTNDMDKTLIVIGFCNATPGAKDLEGWVGETSAGSLIASESGAGRESITLAVPPHWRFKVQVNAASGGLPGGGSCQVTGWPG